MPCRNSDASLFRRLNVPKYFPLDRHATIPTVQCSENETHWSEGPLVRLFELEAMGRRFNMPNRKNSFIPRSLPLPLSLPLTLTLSPKYNLGLHITFTMNIGEQSDKR